MLFSRVNSMAVAAWCPRVDQSLLALGTSAGSLDATFDTNGELYIYELRQDEQSASSGNSIVKLSNIKSQLRFTKLCWGMFNDSHPLGVLVCGIEDGSFRVYDAKALKENVEDKENFLMNIPSNSGGSVHINSLEFNKFYNSTIAVGRDDGIIQIWDLNGINMPSSPLEVLNSQSKLSRVSWNKQTSNILGAASFTNGVNIFDTRKRSKIIELKDNNSRNMVSAIEWDPVVATHLITASNDDSAPYLYSWDLRNPNLPESVFTGHRKGVFSISWCSHDSSLLASCGSDNSVLMWNTFTSSVIGEVGKSNNWIFDVQWSSVDPKLLLTSSFDGFVSIYNILRASDEVGSSAQHHGTFNHRLSATRTSVALPSNFVLPDPPKWLMRPAKASFGYGSKLVTFNSQSSAVSIKYVNFNERLTPRILMLEEIINNNSIEARLRLCRNKIEGLEQYKDTAFKYSELCQWKIFEYALSNKIEKNSIKCLYYVKKELDRIMGKSSCETIPLEKIIERISTSNISNFLENDGANCDLRNPNEDSQGLTQSHKLPEEFYTGIEGDDKIISAIYMGDLETSAMTAVEQGNIEDALIIASLGGESLFKSVREVCLEKRISSASYMKIIGHIMRGNIGSIIEGSDLDLTLESSRIILISIIQRYSTDETVRLILYSTLGDKLRQIDDLKNNFLVDYTTMLCYMVSKDCRIIDLWWKMAEYQMKLLSKDKLYEMSPDLLHLEVLQNFMEKVTLYSDIICPIETNFQTSEDADKLNALYPDYIKYIASAGFFKLASAFLERLPLNLSISNNQQNQDDSQSEFVLIKNRILNAAGRKVVAANVPMNNRQFMNTNDPPSAFNSYIPPAPLASQNLSFQRSESIVNEQLSAFEPQNSERFGGYKGISTDYLGSRSRLYPSTVAWISQTTNRNINNKTQPYETAQMKTIPNTNAHSSFLAPPPQQSLGMASSSHPQNPTYSSRDNLINSNNQNKISAFCNTHSVGSGGFNDPPAEILDNFKRSTTKNIRGASNPSIQSHAPPKTFTAPFNPQSYPGAQAPVYNNMDKRGIGTIDRRLSSYKPSTIQSPNNMLPNTSPQTEATTQMFGDYRAGNRVANVLNQQTPLAQQTNYPDLQKMNQNSGMRTEPAYNRFSQPSGSHNVLPLPNTQNIAYDSAHTYGPQSSARPLTQLSQVAQNQSGRIDPYQPSISRPPPNIHQVQTPQQQYTQKPQPPPQYNRT